MENEQIMQIAPRKKVADLRKVYERLKNLEHRVDAIEKKKSQKKKEVSSEYS